MKEDDIRPAELLNKYLELSRIDAANGFDQNQREPIDCIACASLDHEHVFFKYGFGYSQCQSCGTVFQSPRPRMADFEIFYKEAASNEFWANEFFPAVAEARREKILAPRAASLSKSCEKHGINVTSLIDVGAGHGILLEEWRKLHRETSLIAVEPSRSMAEICRAKNIAVFEDVVENVSPTDINTDLVASFEVFEHVHNPFAFIRSLARLAGVGKYVFISTLCVDGFDIQMLWDQSNAVSPPHHLNFVSIDGFHQLFERAGLKILDISTPGVLDVDIVKNAIKSGVETNELNRFTKAILENTALSRNFQTFLSENLLSSHVWVFAEVVEEK